MKPAFRTRLCSDGLYEAHKRHRESPSTSAADEIAPADAGEEAANVDNTWT
jgi:hypothetical protein